MTASALSHVSAPLPASLAGAVDSKRFLNLGCGRRFRRGWTNVDTVSSDPDVIAHDLRHPIPFPDGSFDLVYHSHLLEHLTPEDGARLLEECHRVLAPRGVIRVAVPDLEQIVRLYLHALDRASRGEESWRYNYDWLMIELLDQTVRERTGGGHGRYLNRDVIPNLEFVVRRHGREAEDSVTGQRLRRVADAADMTEADSGQSLVAAARLMLRQVWRLHSADGRAHARDRLVRWLLGADYELLELGRFRRSGEVHQWMYDRYSLSRALVDAGFVAPRQMTACESHVERWADACLDADASGQVHKPDSIFVEAVKPDVSRYPARP